MRSLNTELDSSVNWLPQHSRTCYCGFRILLGLFLVHKLRNYVLSLPETNGLNSVLCIVSTNLV